MTDDNKINFLKPTGGGDLELPKNEIETEQAGEKEQNEQTQKHEEIKKQVEGDSKKPTKKPQHATKPIPNVRDPITVKIEKILESGLQDEFAKLPNITKQEFKIKGETTADAIRELLNDTHIKVKRIFWLIIEWLKMLPGVNKFFLEQEAKIKTDKIIMLFKEQKNKP